MRFSGWISLGAALVLCTSATVAEADNLCVDLEAQLVQLDRGNVGGDPRQFDAPIARLRAQLDVATEQARNGSCMGGFLFFKPTPDPRCGKVMAAANKLQANLDQLTAQQQQLESQNDPFAVSRQRRDLLSQLAQNNCGPQYAAASQQSGFGGFLNDLFGNARIDSLDDEGPYSQPVGGTYQTLCVRTCDGFYFPISFATVPSQFAADEATCQSMCPGGQAELYTHLNPGEDASQMVSLSGQPYTALPNAFRFQKEYDKSCTCQSAGLAVTQGPIQNFSDFGTAGGLEPYDGTTADAAPAVPLPHLMPAPGEDPETIADRAGGFVPRPPSAAAPQTADNTANVRVVGPDFYYGQ
ncbi:MAG TPA: DUF2865 domain-containing protein [Bauldia sp.]|nr:DUF2865 domain-containing protein [Bauldia sp.]